MEPFLELDLRQSATRDIASQVVAACRRARLVLAHTDPQFGGTRKFWDDVLCSVERVPVDEDATTGSATGHLWSSVEFDPERPHRFRYSRSAQPLHTDGSYVPDPPPVVFMACERQASAGGATLFLDGSVLVEMLSRERPWLLKELREQPMRFAKGGSTLECVVIASEGTEPVLRWNYYALAKQTTPAARTRAEALQSFLHELTQRSAPRAILLRPGDAVFFHDSRLLHGRDSFSAEVAGDRLLWKGGLRL